MPMSPRNYSKQTSFTNHLHSILALAKSQGLNQKSLCEKAGIRESSISEWGKGKKNLTILYFLNLLGGLEMTVADYLKLTKRQLTEDQKFEIDLQRFASRNSDKFKLLFKNPKALKLLNQLLNNKVKP